MQLTDRGFACPSRAAMLILFEFLADWFDHIIVVYSNIYICDHRLSGDYQVTTPPGETAVMAELAGTPLKFSFPSSTIHPSIRVSCMAVERRTCQGLRCMHDMTATWMGVIRSCQSLVKGKGTQERIPG